ncbi:MAG: protein TolR [Deltaproteobacteria bacterium]|nr:protein TolR [Deltaproteobacteria bacterium]MBW2105573.1 protein TolR [Deltaproteobacteria bacterium]MCD6265253.1 protein TolR [Deltaproteobacteria bacterium]RLB13544.1 MAG: protein TolR [Deltaproteobacteria bacterium]RLB23943.1 MAG: protein TolR [Deltaproteobacteria bacterium]
MDVGEGRSNLISDINVTPLVDVMLVLLIIFMVTAPMMIHGVKVNLPRTESKSIKSKEDPLILSITKKRLIFIEDYNVTFNALKGKLKKIVANRARKEILLQADKDVPYGFVMKVMSQVKEAGITKVGMITEPLHK